MMPAELIAQAYEKMEKTQHHQTRWGISDVYRASGLALDEFLGIAEDIPELEIRKTGHIFDRGNGVYLTELEIPFKKMIKLLGDEEGVIYSLDEALKTCAGWVSYMVTHPLKAINYHRLWKK